MGLNSTLEPRMHWLGFPSLIRGLTIIQFVVNIALMMRPGMAQYLAFNWDLFIGGEYWRALSHFFLLQLPHPDTPPGLDALGLFFSFIALLIGLFFNDALENAWGIFRTSLFVYGCIIGQMIANFTLGALNLPYETTGGIYLDLAIFFAFATIFPNHTFRLLLLLPVPAWVLAAISAIGLLLQSANNPIFAFFIILAFLPYWFWAIPRLFQHSRQKANIQKRRVDFASKKKSLQGQAFHVCDICGATEQSNPERTFRINSKDAELCSECLEDTRN